MGASILACLVTLAVVPSAAAQSTALKSPAPMDAKPQAVQAVFARYHTQGSPGCAVSVTQNSATVFSDGYGLVDLEHQQRITPQTAFYAASVSKQFTAAAIGLLALRGQLALDTNVRDLVPEVPDYGTPITVRHLLHHTSGFRDYLGLQGLAGWPEDMLLTERDFLAMVSRQKGLNFPPGTKHLYSNTGYVLLSLIVRTVSGLSLREFAAKELFTPLGMTNTTFRDNHLTAVPRRATAYAPAAGGGFRTSVPGFDVIGDGGLFTTAEDLAKWNPTALDGPLKAPGLSAMLVTPGRLNSGESLAYAMGLRLETYRGLALVRHGGSYGGYRTEMTVAPSANMTIAVLCNLSTATPYGANGFSQRILDIYLGDQLAPPITPPLPGGTMGSRLSGLGPFVARFSDFTGDYFSDELDVRWSIQPGTPSGIAIQRRNLSPLALEPRDPSMVSFTAVGTPLSVRFESDTAGRVTGFVIDSGDMTGILFVKLPARQ